MCNKLPQNLVTWNNKYLLSHSFCESEPGHTLDGCLWLQAFCKVLIKLIWRLAMLPHMKANRPRGTLTGWPYNLAFGEDTRESARWKPQSFCNPILAMNDISLPLLITSCESWNPVYTQGEMSTQGHGYQEVGWLGTSLKAVCDNSCFNLHLLSVNSKLTYPMIFLISH